MHLATYIELLHKGERMLASSLDVVADGYSDESDVFHTAHTLSQINRTHIDELEPFRGRFGEAESMEGLGFPPITEVRRGAIGLIHDLQELLLLGTFVDSTWTLVLQGAQACRDEKLIELCGSARSEIGRELAWFNSRMKQAAPQALLVAR
jgi:hypothetical protein